jgi:bacterioferritin
MDLNKIKKLASESIDQGALTKDYPLDLKQVYKLLNDALATEIMCVLRYRHHQVIAKSINQPQVAAEFEEHAVDEQNHMMMIAERINQLGGDPDFNPATVPTRTATEYGSNDNDLEKLIKEDLVAERIAIMVYREMITFFGNDDPTTRRMLEEILKDEEEHANDLADLIAH